MNLNFTIKTYDELDLDLHDILIESYRRYYEKMYGVDAFDAFLKVTKKKSFNFKNKTKMFKKYSDNYKRAIKSFERRTLLVLAYDDNNNLIGASRIKKNRVLDVVFCDLDKKDERYYWPSIIEYIEYYLKNKKYKKMYIEVPLKEGPLLVRASKLGFVEDSSDIKIGKEITYTLNKDI